MTSPFPLPPAPGPAWAAQQPTITLDETKHTVTVVPYSFYGMDGDDFAAITGAFTLLGTRPVPQGMSGAAAVTVGEVKLAAGATYTGYSPLVKAPYAILNARQAMLQPVAEGITAVYDHSPLGTGGQFGNPAQLKRGGVYDLIIDGTFAGDGATGLDVGDGWGGEIKAVVQNFTGEGSLGVYAVNRCTWTEKWSFDLHLENNSAAFTADVAGGDPSFEYDDFLFHLFANPGQQGITFCNGAYKHGRTFLVSGNFGSSPTPLATAVLTLTGGDGTRWSGMRCAMFGVCVEVNGNGAHGPATVAFGSSSNYLQECAGVLAFQDVPWSSAVNAGANFTFTGPVCGDPVLEALVAKGAGGGR